MSLEDEAYAFVHDLSGFDYRLSALDRVWDIVFPDRGEGWHHLEIVKYRQTFYLRRVDGSERDLGGLEIEPKKTIRAVDPMGGASSRPLEEDEARTRDWSELISSARRWLQVVRKDWIRANKRIRVEYPLNRRYGIVPNAVVRSSLSDAYRLDREVGKANTRKFVRLVEDGFFLRAENTTVETMTAAGYFEYCKIAYLAGKRKGETVDGSLCGRDMYERYADGRHEGLLDIDEASAQEFADWIDGTHPRRARGGHPWEIKRGGNTTHIDLAVRRPSFGQEEGFTVELRGESIGRLAETVRMFLAIHDAAYPICIANPEGVRKRLLAQDNVGIVPGYSSLHRANQRFREGQDVFDVMHYDDLGRFKRRITPFITWEPLPVTRPRDA